MKLSRKARWLIGVSIFALLSMLAAMLAKNDWLILPALIALNLYYFNVLPPR